MTLLADWIVVDWDRARAHAVRNGAAFAPGSVWRVRLENGNEYEVVVREGDTAAQLLAVADRCVGYRAAMGEAGA